MKTISVKKARNYFGNIFIGYKDDEKVTISMSEDEEFINFEIDGNLTKHNVRLFYNNMYKIKNLLN